VDERDVGTTVDGAITHRLVGDSVAVAGIHPSRDFVGVSWELQLATRLPCNGRCSDPRHGCAVSLMPAGAVFCHSLRVPGVGLNLEEAYYLYYHPLGLGLHIEGESVVLESSAYWTAGECAEAASKRRSAFKIAEMRQAREAGDHKLYNQLLWGGDGRSTLQIEQDCLAAGGAAREEEAVDWEAQEEEADRLAEEKEEARQQAMERAALASLVL
jgi:hypothetical protein